MNKNLNISGTHTDTKDNVRYLNQVHKVDYRGISLLVVSVVIVCTLVWIISYLFARMHCWFESLYECTAASYIFIGFPLIIGAALTFTLFSFIPLVMQWVKNSEYMQWRGVVTHRDDLRIYAEKVIDVAKTSAHSERTAGLDTFNPSISRSTHVKEKEVETNEQEKSSNSLLADLLEADVILDELNK